MIQRLVHDPEPYIETSGMITRIDKALSSNAGKKARVTETQQTIPETPNFLFTVGASCRR